jgi:hypothetical protein
MRTARFPERLGVEAATCKASAACAIETPVTLSIHDRLDRRTTFHVHMGAGDGAVLAHSLLTTERHRMAWDGTRRHRTTRRRWTRAWPQQLRIRCPKGRGGSNPPSRTTSDLRIFGATFPDRWPNGRLAHGPARLMPPLVRVAHLESSFVHQLAALGDHHSDRRSFVFQLPFIHKPRPVIVTIVRAVPGSTRDRA